MKPRPRQIDNSKPFLISNSLDAFSQAEGIEMDIKSSDKIITPDMLLQASNSRPKEKAEPLLKSVNPVNHREDYIKYRYPLYPDGMYYELTEEDLHFLATFNEKITIPIRIEDLEQFISHLDQKSGKDVVIDFPTFHSLKLALPKTIMPLTYQQQEQLYSYYKKLRENLRDQQARPLLRSLMHPYFEDSNPHLAFRPRSQPIDRSMKLRRGNLQNLRGVGEMENVGQKLIQLKKEMQTSLNLLDLCAQREKAMEIDRRYSFCKFIKEVVNQLKKEKEQSQELKFWQKECFVKEITEKCAINILERSDEMFDVVCKDMAHWKDYNDKLRKDTMKKDDHIVKFEKQFDDLLTEKRTTSVNSDEDRKTKPIIQPPILQPSPPDERLDSVARFIATFYLEAKRYKLGFDQVLNDHFPIVKPAQQNESVPPAFKTQLKYQLLQIQGSDLIYRLPSIQQTQHNYYWEDYHDPANNNSLHHTHSYFREKVNEIMEMADTDQMLYSNTQEDEKHEEEELKQFRKKIKLTQTRSVSVVNGTASLHKSQ